MKIGMKNRLKKKKECLTKHIRKSTFLLCPHKNEIWDIIWAFNRPGDAKKITILGNAHLEFGATLRYSEIDHLVNATHEVWNLGWS